MKIFMLGLLLTICGIALGQNQLKYNGVKAKIISGRVTASDGTGVMGATIRVQGTKIGVMTNSEGVFALSVPDSLYNNNIKLNLTYSGYASYLISFDSGKYSVDKFVNVILNPGEIHPHLAPIPPPEVVHPIPPPHIPYHPAPYIERITKNSAPNFPWPPPDFSSDLVLDKNYFRNPKTLADIDLILRKVLDALKYNDRSYYSVPNGFALVTRIEQTDEDGQALDPPDRWSVKVDALDQGGWSAYIKALVFPPTGYFRIIVFTITDQPFKSSGKSVSESIASSWLREGLNILPSEVGNQAFTDKHNCTVLIYEFKKVETGNADIIIPGMLTGKDHLDKSGILFLLSRY